MHLQRCVFQEDVPVYCDQVLIIYWLLVNIMTKYAARYKQKRLDEQSSEHQVSTAVYGNNTPGEKSALQIQAKQHFAFTICESAGARTVMWIPVPSIAWTKLKSKVSRKSLLRDCKHLRQTGIDILSAVWLSRIHYDKVYWVATVSNQLCKNSKTSTLTKTTSDLIQWFVPLLMIIIIEGNKTSHCVLELDIIRTLCLQSVHNNNNNVYYHRKKENTRNLLATCV